MYQAGGGYHFNWSIVIQHLPMLYDGLFLALKLAVVALFIGSIIGIAGAWARASKYRVVAAVFAAYVEFVRNVPLLVLVFFAYFALPIMGIKFLDNVASFEAAFIFYSGAYLTEVFRSGLAAVPEGYVQAAKAIGLTPLQRGRYIVLPVMFRIVLPALSNTFISLFKDTSIASAIGVKELTFGAVYLDVNFFRVIEAWSVVAAMYLVTAAILASLLRLLERRYAVIK